MRIYFKITSLNHDLLKVFESDGHSPDQDDILGFLLDQCGSTVIISLNKP